MNTLIFKCIVTGSIIYCTLLMSTARVNAGETASDQVSDLKKLSIEQLMDMEIDTVYGASKYEQKITEAPSSVSIISSAEIKKFGHRTLADILKSVRGFYITNDRNYSYIGVRGFGRPGDYNSRIMVQVDGHRINEYVYDSVLVGEEFILDVDLIDRVEIIRGPSSSLYGNSAFFAIINVVTRKGRDFNSLEASSSAGSLNNYKGRLSYGNIFRNGLEMVASGSGLYSEGERSLYYNEFDSPLTNNGITRNTDNENSYNFFTNISYHDFTLQGAYVSREKGIPTGAFQSDFNDRRNGTTDSRGYIDLKYEKNFENDFSVTTRLFYDHSKYHGDYIFSGIINKDTEHGDSLGLDLMLKKTLFQKHTAILGFEYIYNIHQDQQNFNEQPYSLFLDDRRHSANWALYTQDEFAINKRLTLNVGVRWDHYHTFGNTINPRLALIYKPFDTSILKFIYGSAFRAPNAYELYYNDGGITAKTGNGLKPETIKTYEIVYEQYWGEYLRSSVSGFHYETKNLISQTVDPVDSLLVFKNIDKVKANGLELELNGKWASGLEAKAAYTLQKAETSLNQQVLTNSPQHLAKVGIIAPLVANKLYAGLEEHYSSKRKTKSNSYTDGYFLTNITLFGQPLSKTMELSVSIYNLFDKKYSDPGGEEHLQESIRQNGRNFRLKFVYKF
jgi:outer membrane receptor for ferrienterochelin and colicins